MRRVIPRSWSRFARRWLKDDRSIAGRALLLGLAFLVGLVAA
ncbi:MAG TPA: hypothetical protein VFD92_03725 [Candidatus Binatia bacterium]|nr:hypothetical protein [Candidatus Binatia bacterium]